MNYKKIILLLIIFNTNFLKSDQLKGLFESAKDVPRFSIFYLGTQTTNDENGFFTIPHDSPKQNPGILVGDFDAALRKKNTVKKLQLKDRPHKYFKQVTDLNGATNWHEYRLSNKSIPENTVVIRMNPHLIKNVVNWDVELPSNVTKLPKIILENDDKALSKSSKKSLLASLDEKRLHRTVTVKTKEYNDKRIKSTLAE